MNREEIKEFLPHREPMLLVDELTMDENSIAHGVYHVRGDEWFLKGHFPGNPVVPGVIQCEIMAQACAILLGDRLKGKTPYFTGLNNVKFREKVRPGDVFEVTAWVEKSKYDFYFTKAEGRVNGTLCVKGDLSFALVKNE